MAEVGICGCLFCLGVYHTRILVASIMWVQPASITCPELCLINYVNYIILKTC